MSRLVTMLLASATALCVGCGGGGVATGGSGTLSVYMADAPDPTITSVLITITRVEAHHNGGWEELSVTPTTYELLDLVQTDTLIGTNGLPAGRYNQVRLFVSEGTVTDSEGTHPLVIPSNLNTGIKININADVLENEVTQILIDFNVSRSIVRLGNGVYHLRPVIPAVLRVLSGTISGVATDGADPLHGASVIAKYTDGTAYPIGTDVNSTVTLDTGEFKIWALLAGTYELRLSWTNPNTNEVLTAVVPGVVVVPQQDTSVGVVVLAP